MKFELIEYIKKHGSEKAKETFVLKESKNENYSLLKYNQIKSPFKRMESKEARGIIFNRDTLEVVSIGFIKFPTVGKDYDINPSDYIIRAKEDGSMIQLWYCKIQNRWIVSTTGEVEALSVINGTSKSFTDLFWETAPEDIKEKLEINNNYIFELKTTKNIVVQKRTEDEVVLINMRDKEMDEVFCIEDEALKLGVKSPRIYTFPTKDALFDSLKTVKNYSDNFEGYVCTHKVTKERLKIKSNTYIIHHQIGGNTDLKNLSKYRLLECVINGEIDEVSATLPFLKNDLILIKSKLDEIITPIENGFNRVIQIEENKEFFIEMQKLLNFNKKRKIFGGILTKAREDYNSGELKDFNYYLESLDYKKVYKCL